MPQDPKTMMGETSRVTDEMRECIDACLACERVCTETVTYCLERGGEHADPDHIKLLLDCAEVCRTSAALMARGSEFHGAACGVCARVCEACADDCEAFSDDARMQACAAACRHCAELCLDMSEDMA